MDSDYRPFATASSSKTPFCGAEFGDEAKTFQTCSGSAPTEIGSPPDRSSVGHLHPVFLQLGHDQHQNFKRPVRDVMSQLQRPQKHSSVEWEDEFHADCSVFAHSEKVHTEVLGPFHPLSHVQSKVWSHGYIYICISPQQNMKKSCSPLLAVTPSHSRKQHQAELRS